MPNPRYQAFVDVAGKGLPNHEYIDFLKQMRRLYAAQDSRGNMLIEDQDDFTVFVQACATLYTPAAPTLAVVSGSLVERIEP